MDGGDSHGAEAPLQDWQVTQRWVPSYITPQEQERVFDEGILNNLNNRALEPVEPHTFDSEYQPYRVQPYPQAGHILPSFPPGPEPVVDSAYPYYPPPPALQQPGESEPWSPYNLKHWALEYTPPGTTLLSEYAPLEDDHLPYPTSSSDIAGHSIYGPISNTLPHTEPLPSPTRYYPVLPYPDAPSSPVHPVAPTQPASSSGTSKRYACNRPGCRSKPFTRVADLNRHIATIHTGIKHRCGKCAREFNRADHLREHMRSYHHVEIGKRKPSDKNIQPEPSVSNEGIISGSGEEQRPGSEELSSINDPNRPSYTCGQCGKLFVRAGDLRKHEKVHMLSKDRDHKCDVCGRAFLYPKDLERHKRTQHPSADTPAFFCPILGCARSMQGKPFYRKDKLQEHARKIHGHRLDELVKVEAG
ncbi:hypothetical protein GQ43DRAFT_225107 [Delitschia confertaspora ATCC 74209]|uniref:C2H2-type domain-containing protein n=1 Tax=Delitschia confertaspora ATCC 74209 TaxID=1513339 RepID=A0A9P4JT48_9PLEO|nr:hypothetical protein GQ43DRAFT_225107 [Delitschia confertaspora ATCC 74209]